MAVNVNDLAGVGVYQASLADPHGMLRYQEGFLEWMAIKNYSVNTIRTRREYLGYFIDWCYQRGVVRPSHVTKPILDRYQKHLFHHRKKNGDPLSTSSQCARLVPVKAFFKWLAKENHLLYNPASELEMPRLEKRLPKAILSESEVETVLNQTDVTTPNGIRDRALLETLYSTGIRRLELIHLSVHDIDVERGTLMIRQGKGKKDRMLPIGDRAVAWVEKYLNEVRPEMVTAESGQTLFLSAVGKPYIPNRLTAMVRGHIDAAKLNKRGSCHLFRHSMATHMLEHGADIRFIQAMLGHATLDTTQIYTQVSIKKLKEVHSLTHPAKLQRRTGGALQDEPEETPAPTVEALLAALDQEAIEDSED